MTVYVVIGVWSGCIEHVTAWIDKGMAETRVKRLKEKWRIAEGHEAESPHVVDMHELHVHLKGKQVSQ
jgi:hypothetical protein